MYDELELQLLNKLNSDLSSSGYAIELFPDDIANYQLNHPKGAVLLSLNNAIDTAPAGIQQAELLAINVTVISRSLRTESGIYQMIEEVSRSLTNNFNWDGSQIHRQSWQYTERREDKWIYTISFILPLIRYISE